MYRYGYNHFATKSHMSGLFPTCEACLQNTSHLLLQEIDRYLLTRLNLIQIYSDSIAIPVAVPRCLLCYDVDQRHHEIG